MALLLLILQTIVMIAGLALFAQLIVGIFSWSRRGENIVYQFFGIIARPFVSLARAITPRVILDAHVPIVAFIICLFAYFALAFAHRDVCMDDLTQDGCAKWLEARSR